MLRRCLVQVMTFYLNPLLDPVEQDLLFALLKFGKVRGSIPIIPFHPGANMQLLNVFFLFSFQVSAIFCCSSSNSTMSQPATQVSVQPPDTFSIYSYSKQPVVTSDTLRSGPLADTLRNETLLRDTGASPQYRVKT